MTLTLRARVALLVAVAVGLAVALATAAAYVTVRHELLHQLDASLIDRAEAAASTSLAEPGLLVRLPSAALGPSDVRVAIVRDDGSSIVALGEEPVPFGRPEVQVAAGERSRSLRTVSMSGTSYRAVAVPISEGLALIVARSLTESERVLGALTAVLLLVGVVGIVVAASTGLAVARAGLAPVERLTAAAEHIARTEELAPIEVGPNGKTDEISRLALAFNAMLASLADSRNRQRQLVADAGHELRTPLTSLRTNLDLLAQTGAGAGLPPGERDQLLADVRAQVAELSGLVSDLVALARDADPAAEAVDVELAGVVERAIARARRRAGGLRFAVDVQPWRVRGDPGLLERAVTNLLDNAVKWSPPGGTVSVRLHGGVLRVADEGPGIDERDRPHVFDRFYRAPQARTMPGSGLGLAIVAQVAEASGGSARVESADTGGAVLVMALPGVDPAESPEPANADPWAKLG